MARKRKPRRRTVYSFTFGFPDGAVVSCGPSRKPTTGKIKEESIHVDDDGVFREHMYSANCWINWEPDERRRMTGILANRLNMRRSIRDLVLPELAEIQLLLQDMHKQLARLEEKFRKPNQKQKPMPTPAS